MGVSGKSGVYNTADNKYRVAFDAENIYFMLHQKYIPIQEYETLTEKNEYHYFKKDDELKDKNEGNVENGNDFKNCKFFLRQRFNINAIVNVSENIFFE